MRPVFNVISLKLTIKPLYNGTRLFRKEQTEIQSDHFQKREVSIHVTLIYRHAVLNVDGVHSANDDPHIVTEHLL